MDFFAVITLSVPIAVRFLLSVVSPVAVKVGAVTVPVKVGFNVFALKSSYVSISVLV